MKFPCFEAEVSDDRWSAFLRGFDFTIGLLYNQAVCDFCGESVTRDSARILDNKIVCRPCYMANSGFSQEEVDEAIDEDYSEPVECQHEQLLLF